MRIENPILNSHLYRNEVCIWGEEKAEYPKRHFIDIAMDIRNVQSQLIEKFKTFNNDYENNYQ
ncbi:MAG: hypothetical protein JXR34_01350 [Bacteroidales bacterium]|nr:hypothetical protein [Bacteroidales bacterium]